LTFPLQLLNEPVVSVMRLLSSNKNWTEKDQDDCLGKMEKEKSVPGGDDRMFPIGDEHGCHHGDGIYG